MKYLKKSTYFLKIFLFSALVFMYFLLDDNLANVENSNEITGAFRVVDGDTVVIEGKRIRLIGIDAPEKSQVCYKGSTKRSPSYACGKSADRALKQLIKKGRLSCKGSKHDRYGRLLGVCYVGHLDINREMVSQGWAVSYNDYKIAEWTARLNEVGMWQGTFDTPFEWRKRHR